MIRGSMRLSRRVRLGRLMFGVSITEMGWMRDNCDAEIRCKEGSGG